MQEIGSLASRFWMCVPQKNGTDDPIFEISKFWSNLNWRFGDPTQEMTHQILSGHPIDLKLVANRPG